MTPKTNKIHLKNQIAAPEHPTEAQIILTHAKQINVSRCCELRIDERTVIMVTPENNNPAYAEAYRKRLYRNHLNQYDR